MRNFPGHVTIEFVKKATVREVRLNKTEDDEYLKKVSRFLYENITNQKREETYASVKEVLSLLGIGTLLVCSVVAPGTAHLFKLFKRTDEKWKKFNKPYLRKTLLNLEKQKLIKVDEKENGECTIEITTQGKKKLLHHSLTNISISKPKIWDGNWYFVSYDIPKGHDYLRDQIRNHLEEMGFYRFQESLYLHAYPCEKEIEFLREYLGLGKYVRLIRASNIENDKPFRKYFGI